MSLFLKNRIEKNRSNTQLETEAGVGLTLTAFLGTVALFFAGLIILNLRSLPSIVELAVVYLIISTVAFCISSVIYSNVTGATEEGILRVRMIQAGNWISEYAGLYLFLSAIPIVILGVTDSVLVQLTTAIICYGGLVLYSSSSYSLDDRRFGKGTERFLHTVFLSLFFGVLYSVAKFAPENLLTIGIVGIVVVFFFSLFSFRSN